MSKKVYLFDWGNTLMKDFKNESGPMYLWSEVDIMPKADIVLEKLSKQADCYIATNAKDSNKADIIKALKRVKIDLFFKDIFCYKEIGFPKPSLQYFQEVHNRLDTPKDYISMIGDNLEKDITGALEFGFNAILYDPQNKYTDYHGLKIQDLTDLLH